jgi:hypothetical protein
MPGQKVDPRDWIPPSSGPEFIPDTGECIHFDDKAKEWKPTCNGEELHRVANEHALSGIQHKIEQVLQYSLRGFGYAQLVGADCYAFPVSTACVVFSARQDWRIECRDKRAAAVRSRHRIFFRVDRVRSMVIAKPAWGCYPASRVSGRTVGTFVGTLDKYRYRSIAVTARR